MTTMRLRGALSRCIVASSYNTQETKMPAFPEKE
jgi:hypothetical protein